MATELFASGETNSSMPVTISAGVELSASGEALSSFGAAIDLIEVRIALISPADLDVEAGDVERGGHEIAPSLADLTAGDAERGGHLVAQALLDVFAQGVTRGGYLVAPSLEDILAGGVFADVYRIDPTAQRILVPEGGRVIRVISSRIADERVVKSPSETRKPVLDYRLELGFAELLSFVDGSVTITPNTSTNALTVGSPVVGSSEIQLSLTKGEPMVRFSSQATIITATGHQFANGDLVIFAVDEDGALPSGIQEGVEYYVRSVSGDTFSVSESPSSELLTVGDGDGFAVSAYLVSLLAVTSSGQKIESKFLVEVRG